MVRFPGTIIVYFGTYEQDNDYSNGAEGIEWIVLAKEQGRILVISKRALDWQPYNSSSANTTWETCALRAWLNNEFLNKAFTAVEQNMIPTVMVSADANPRFNQNPGNSTMDQVFLLSIPEVNQFLSPITAGNCEVTEYVVSQGAQSRNNNYWWWLRSNGSGYSQAAGVREEGSIDLFGSSIINNHAVRPALWIEVGS